MSYCDNPFQPVRCAGMAQRRAGSRRLWPAAVIDS
jgi:hypothetical protein